MSRRVVVNSIDNTYKKQITYVTFHLWEKWTWDADDKGHLWDWTMAMKSELRLSIGPATLTQLSPPVHIVNHEFMSIILIPCRPPNQSGPDER